MDHIGLLCLLCETAANTLIRKSAAFRAQAVTDWALEAGLSTICLSSTQQESFVSFSAREIAVAIILAISNWQRFDDHVLVCAKYVRGDFLEHCANGFQIT